MTFWGVFTTILMLLAVGVVFIPFVPGPLTVWSIATIYAIATEFTHVQLWQWGIMTLLMLVATTADWWTRLLGLGGEGQLSCSVYLASFIGAILGTIFIPLPLLGTMAGAAGAVWVWVYLQSRSLDDGYRAARGIFVAWLGSFAVEFLVSISIALWFIRIMLGVWGWF
ncbi:MAG: DUF456 domain-containing protein [Phototrophicaceae bacterium]